MAATPKVVTDAGTDLDEGVLNLFINGIKSQVKVNYFTLDFDAGTNIPTVASDASNDGEVVDGDLSWNGSSYVDVVLSGFSTKAVILVSIEADASTNVKNIRAIATSSTAAEIHFTDADFATVDPDGNISANVFIIGY